MRSLEFQSNFELTGYITISFDTEMTPEEAVSKLFRAYGLYNVVGDRFVSRT